MGICFVSRGVTEWWNSLVQIKPLQADIRRRGGRFAFNEGKPREEKDGAKTRAF